MAVDLLKRAASASSTKESKAEEKEDKKAGKITHISISRAANGWTHTVSTDKGDSQTYVHDTAIDLLQDLADDIASPHIRIPGSAKWKSMMASGRNYPGRTVGAKSRTGRAFGGTRYKQDVSVASKVEKQPRLIQDWMKRGSHSERKAMATDYSVRGKVK